MTRARHFWILAIAAATFAWLPFESPLKTIWPSFVAIVSVFVLRNALLGLLSGVISGLILIHNGNPASAFVGFFEDRLIPSLQSSWNISILIFTLVLGGMAALVERGGGIQSALRLLTGKTTPSPKKLMVSTYTLGLLCFFDGLANSMLVGRSMRQPAMKSGVSPEKMAYIVDSTSSAVACVAIISTWIAYQLSMMLVLLAVVILSSWDIGPMRHCKPKSEPTNASVNGNETSTDSSYWQALAPLLVLVFGLIIGLYLSGAKGKYLPVNLETISQAFGAADAALVMLCVSALACITAYLFNRNGIQRAGQEPQKVFAEGVGQLAAPVLILISAWTFSSTLKSLDTITHLVNLLDNDFPPGVLPAIVFITGAMISFSTGTSWGTMGVLMPIALPVALVLDGASGSVIVPATVAAVFSGAVFGDHCSPLSDTTIVSSISCGVEPVDHVRTQLPYALVAAGVAVFIGFLPSGAGVSPWILLAAGGFLIVLIPNLMRLRRA
jgi:Na+/H+ antiporter NhaC